MIREIIKNAIKQASADLEWTTPAEIVIDKPKNNFGDYAVNVAFGLAKQLGKAPAGIAKQLAEKISQRLPPEIERVEAVGGYVNFFLSNICLKKQLSEILKKGNEFGGSDAGKKYGKVIVEYFQNNVAKPPHIGHLRSAVIGDCLLRVFRFLGYEAISDTHIGDWGTQFGILLYAYKEFLKAGGPKSQIEKDPISELNKLYIEISKKIEKNPDLQERGKAEFKKLEAGDEENRKLWQWLVNESLSDFERYRKLLGLLPFDYNLGESFYEDKMTPIFEALKEKNLAVESEGAQIVNLEDVNLGIAILKKSDGASTYLLRDLTTLVYRGKEFNFCKNLYVVDARQSHHFQQLFEIAKRAGFDGENISSHIAFGFMSLPEGAISTRKGNVISLQNLIDEAQKRALEIIKEKNPELKNKEAAAKMVGLAAIKYFDLSHNRKTEFLFTWDKALGFEGNTGPYLQYAHARIQGILRKTSEKTTNSIAYAGEINEYESGLMRKLIQFPEIVEEIIQDYMPHVLCNYLFELSQIFNGFYEAVPVLREKNSDRRIFRLAIISATAQIIKNGLGLLGIEAPAEM